MNWKAIREKAGLTQEAFGKKLGFNNGQYVYSWESGKVKSPSMKTIKKMIKLLKLDPYTIIDPMVNAYEDELVRELVKK